MPNLAKMFVRQPRAISPVIAVLLMIAVTVAASLVAYAWVMGYLGFTTTKVNKAIQIQGMAKSDLGNLVVYVQNVGQGTAKFDPSGSVYVNDKLQESNFDATALTPGQTATIVTNQAIESNEQVKVRVVTTDGTFAELTNASPLAVSSEVSFPIFRDSFEGGDFSAWTYTSGTIEVESEIRYKGLYASETTLSSTGSYGIVIKNIGGSYSELYTRSYVQISATPNLDQSILIGSGITQADGALDLSVPFIANDAGTLKWSLKYATNYAYAQFAYSGAAEIKPGQWYSVETYYKSAVSGAGEARLWVDGFEVVAVTGISTDSRIIGGIQVGGYTPAAFTVNCYVDDVIIDSHYIGP